MSQRVTINDISKKMGVSTTTITRALNGKPKVSDDLRNSILKTAEIMGYRPNKTAQALARNELVLGIVYPREPYEFWRYVEKGMEQAINSLMDNKVTGIFLPVKDQSSTDETREALNNLYKKGVDGIILSTGFGYKEYRDIVHLLEQKGIPVVYLLNDMLDDTGIGCVKLNGYVTGKMASEFLSFCNPDKKPVVIFTSDKGESIHKECIEGFLCECEKISLTVKGVYETQDDKNIAYYLTEKVLNDIPNLGGIYISSYNSVAVCECLEKNNRTKDIVVIGQDLYPELAEKLQNGSLKATLFQDPFVQGITCVNKLYKYLTEINAGKSDFLTTPVLVMNSNLVCYRDKY